MCQFFLMFWNFPVSLPNPVLITINKTIYYVLSDKLHSYMFQTHGGQILKFDHWLFPLMESPYTPMMSKLNTVCFVTRTLQAIMSTETLRMVYFVYVHSSMSYGIIFGGNQPYTQKIFRIQKRVIRIITNSRIRDSCRELFQRLEILPLYSQYIFSLSIFVIKNKHLYNTNNQIHSVHTRFKTDLHPPIANLTKFQEEVYYSGIKIF
jgi:hypothetical protein